ncbi:MAG: hypothetical protein N2039_02180 [Gemmataceae bacterium]|nr:hypothetical protein [Gemmataceae bacterium]
MQTVRLLRVSLVGRLGRAMPRCPAQVWNGSGAAVRGQAEQPDTPAA